MAIPATPRTLPLTDRQRLIYSLWLDGATAVEIAEELKTSERAIELQMYRSRKRLRAAGLKAPHRNDAKPRTVATLHIGSFERSNAPEFDLRGYGHAES